MFADELLRHVAVLTSVLDIPAAADQLSGAILRAFPPDAPARVSCLRGASQAASALARELVALAEVARRLGIGRSTLYRKLADLGISDVA
jgi:transcriptional regulator of acetoin/glycerol metabolism